VKQIVAGIFSTWRYSRFMEYVHDVLDHPKRESIEKRLVIIKFYDDYGEAATRRAFGASRSTVYLWKQKLKRAGGKTSSLAPGNKAPKNKRKRVVHPFVEQFIVEYRECHPGADKTTLTPSVAVACRKAGIKPPSESTIGRIIHDLKEVGRLPKGSRIRINGISGKLRELKTRQAARKIRRKGFHPRQPGDLVEMDTVAIFVDGLRRYMFTALDVTTRFAFAYTYKSNSSANGRDFLRKFVALAPFEVRHIQTDNGSEFSKYFADSCQDNNLIHFYNYPRHPQSNGHLERFNRTAQEQFADWHLDILDDPGTFNRFLMDYLIWYNTEKPHRGIGNKPPLRYYVDTFLPQEKSNMPWTLTAVCPKKLFSL